MMRALNRSQFLGALFLAVCLVAIPVHGNLSETMKLEGDVTLKLRSILTPFDPSAIVLVNIEQIPFHFELPGLNLSISDLTFSSEHENLNRDDIKRIHIRIQSQVPVPDKLKSLLNAAIPLSSEKKVFLFEPLNIQWAEAPLEKPTLPPAQTDRPLVGSSWVWGLLVSLWVLLAMRYFRVVSEGFVDRLVSGLFEKQSALHLVRSSASGATQNIQSLSPESILALFSDCYWCEQDDYGAWIWQQITTEQRLHLFQNWKFTPEYARTLSNVTPKMMDHHLHPSYLKPTDLSLVSLADCQKWVKQNTNAWYQLTPIRHAHLSLPFRERIRLEQSRRDPAPLAAPAPSTTERTLPSQWGLGELSEADEIVVLDNPSFVGPDLRKQFPSLVWVALLDPKEREALLAPIPAKDLATVWVGPEPVLEKVGSALTERKLRLVKQWLTRTSPDRHNDTMQYLVGQAVRMLDKPPDIETNRVAA
jgi:hypothetical protein